MRTLELEIAVMGWAGIRKNLVVPNVSWGAGLHECDVLFLTKSGYAVEVEIKASKSDLVKDKEKKHGHVSNKIARLYFAVPEKLAEAALEHAPARAGVLIVKPDKRRYYGYKVTEIRKCKRNMNAVKWTPAQRLNLARLGAMRIIGLKRKILKLRQ